MLIHELPPHNTVILSNHSLKFCDEYFVCECSTFQPRENILLDYRYAQELLGFLSKKIPIHHHKIFLFDEKTFSLKRYKTKQEILYNRLKSIIDHKDVVIFGTEKAGHIAFRILNYFHVKIHYFVDDYQKGYFDQTNIEIIDRKILELKDLTHIGCVVVGPAQKGLGENTSLCALPIFRISDIFAGEWQ